MPNKQIMENNYRYAFQGQELDPETGMEAFQLRLWDGRIGRWLTVDPYEQHFSPYIGMGNNPVNRIDPDGGWDGSGDGIPSILSGNYQDPVTVMGPQNSIFASTIQLPEVVVFAYRCKTKPSFNKDGGMPRMSFPIIINGGNNYSISIKGIAFLAQREGTILHPYNDSKGFATIGIGHLIAKRNVNSQDKLDWAWLNTGEEAKALFNKDLKTVYEPAINKMVKVKLTPYQYDAIVSFTYNVGVHGLKISKFLNELNKGNYNGELMLNFHKPSSIIGRRVKEVNLFNNGQY